MQGILFSIFVLIDDLKFSRGQLLLLDSDESSERSADGHQDSTRWHTTPPAACNQSSSHWTKPQLPSTQPKPQSSVTQSVLVSDLDPHSVLTGNHPLSGQFVENMLSTSLSFVLSEVVLVGSILYLPTSSLQYLCYSFFIRLVVYFYWVVKICKVCATILHHTLSSLISLPGASREQCISGKNFTLSVQVSKSISFLPHIPGRFF